MIHYISVRCMRSIVLRNNIDQHSGRLAKDMKGLSVSVVNLIGKKKTVNQKKKIFALHFGVLLRKINQ